jgi:hypothetical protein
MPQSCSPQTTARGSEIWFEIEAIIDIPAEVEPQALEDALRFWTSSSDARATLVFDKYCRTDVSPL